jgi:hypothetical protein
MGLNISATAGSTTGTNFLVSLAGQSVTVLEFQGHPGNNALTGAISFSKTRRNHMT